MVNSTERQNFNVARAKFNAEFADIIAIQKKPTIVVLGQVGVGKTTLIKNVLGADTQGKDIVPEDAIGHADPTTQEFITYKDEYITLIDSKGFEPGMDIKNFTDELNEKVQETQENSSIENHVHLAWYCIQGAGGRVTDGDISLITKTLGINRTLIVITKTDIAKPEQLKGIKQSLIRRGIPESNIVAVSEKDIAAMKVLVEKSTDILPDAYKKAFVAKQLLNLEAKKIASQKIIKKASRLAGASGIIPFFDFLLILPTQRRMVQDLSLNYGFSSKDINTKILTTSYLTVIGGSMGANFLFDLINPVFGMIAGSLNAQATTAILGIHIDNYFTEVSERIINGESIESIEALSFDKDKLERAAKMFKSVNFMKKVFS